MLKWELKYHLNGRGQWIILLVSPAIKEIPPGKRNVGLEGGVGVNACSRVCESAWNWIFASIYISLSFVSDVHSGVAQKYQDMPGFMTDDILSCLLVINLKLSRGTFFVCHVTGVTKRRINKMFWTNSKCYY